MYDGNDRCHARHPPVRCSRARSYRHGRRRRSTTRPPSARLRIPGCGHRPSLLTVTGLTLPPAPRPATIQLSHRPRPRPTSHPPPYPSRGSRQADKVYDGTTGAIPRYHLRRALRHRLSPTTRLPRCLRRRGHLRLPECRPEHHRHRHRAERSKVPRRRADSARRPPTSASITPGHAYGHRHRRPAGTYDARPSQPPATVHRRLRCPRHRRLRSPTSTTSARRDIRDPTLGVVVPSMPTLSTPSSSLAFFRRRTTTTPPTAYRSPSPSPRRSLSVAGITAGRQGVRRHDRCHARHRRRCSRARSTTSRTTLRSTTPGPAVGAFESSDAGSGHRRQRLGGLTLTGAQAGDYVLSPTADHGRHHPGHPVRHGDHGGR